MVSFTSRILHHGNRLPDKIYTEENKSASNVKIYTEEK
jgi:hypothetical protein